MIFYTHVFPFGNRMFVRGYENGRQFSHKLDYYPTLYVPSKKNDSEWRTLDGRIVDEVKPGLTKEVREFVKRYENIEGFDIYGNTNYTCQYISDTYDCDINWDVDQVRTFYLDIETATENGFPDIKSANEEILLITIKDSKTKEVVTFGFKEFTTERKDVRYVICNSEQHMLKEFMIFWQQNYPDVITGWNTDFFDIPYLVKRIERELGETFANKLSPWGYINERKTFIKGSEEVHYDIHGISQLDYLQLYKKFTYSKQESYRLDYIAEQELGDKKKVNPGDSFKEFYTQHWQQFVEYNIHDVELVEMLDDKMRLLELCMTMAYNAKINYEDVFSQVRMWDSIIYNHLRAKKIVIPAKGYSSKSEQFEGAYVKDPIVGAHKWVASFDATSLYPSIMQTLNISPETYIGMLPGTTVDRLLEKNIDKPEGVALAANGAMFNTNKKGMYGEIIDLYMTKRKKAKTEMLEAQSLLELIKEEKKNRNLL